MVHDRVGEGMGKGEYDRGGEGKWCMIGWGEGMGKGECDRGEEGKWCMIGWGKVWEKGSMIGVGRVSGV